jgi:DNA-directed RNA polymerase subunit RPC12/RpoP
MTQKGLHTWDMNLQYYRCPKCGYIIEDRQGGHNKEIICGRCSHHFSENKTHKKSYLPIFSDPQPIEWDWSHGKQ